MNNKKIEQEFMDFCKNDLEIREKIEVIALLNAISVVLIKNELITEEELNDLKEQSFNKVIKLYMKELTDEVIKLYMKERLNNAKNN